MSTAPSPSDAWWREGVLYQVYPRSYQDSDGDGHGDLPGLIDRLDHLEWLGVDGIWLSPTFPSPNRDWGYDVADYRGVHPDFGTLEDMDRLIEEAGKRGIRVLLDLVPNHTSDQHAWFVEASSSRDAPKRDWYVWADGDEPPNNWQGAFGGIAWTFHEPTGQWYLHNFLPGQPDLNWWNPEVRTAFEDILTYWFDRGVAGFRIDVAHSMIKDPELRDDPPAGPGDHPREQERGLRQINSMNRPEGHEILQSWRALADARPEPHPILVGETFVYDFDRLIGFYGAGDDELHLAFNIPFAIAELDADELRGIVETMEARLPEAAWPVYMASNHDIRRLASHWAAGDEAKARVGLLILLTLRGTPFLYAGDEIALPDGEIPADRILDVGDRDPCRTPMPWEPGPGGGFTTPDAEPWLPMTDPDERNVADQRDDPGSTLRFTRDVIALRRAEAGLRTGAYETVDAPEGAWAWRRGDGLLVAVNLGDAPVTIDDVTGDVAVATDRARDGESVAGALELAPSQGVVVRLS
jgi:alpha-glucosidase